MGERAWLPHECFLAPNQGTPCLGTSCMQTTRTVSPNHLLNNSSTGDKVLSHWWCLVFVQTVLGSLCCTVHRPLCLESGKYINYTLVAEDPKQRMEQVYGAGLWNSSMEQVYGTAPWNNGTSPWNSSMEQLHGTTPWNSSMEQLHGSAPWNNSMEQLHGTAPWNNSMEQLHGTAPCMI